MSAARALVLRSRNKHVSCRDVSCQVEFRLYGFCVIFRGFCYHSYGRPHHWRPCSPPLAACTTTDRLSSCGHGVSSTERSISSIRWSASSCCTSAWSALILITPTAGSGISSSNRRLAFIPVATSIFWNSLPPDIQSSATVAVFCHKLETYHQLFPDILLQLFISRLRFRGLCNDTSYFSHAKNSDLIDRKIYRYWLTDWLIDWFIDLFIYLMRLIAIAYRGVGFQSVGDDQTTISLPSLRSRISSGEAGDNDEADRRTSELRKNCSRHDECAMTAAGAANHGLSRRTRLVQLAFAPHRCKNAA